MKKIYSVLTVFVFIAFAACTSIDMATYEKGDLYAELETNDSKMVTLSIKNAGNAEIQLIYEKAAYTINEKTYPLVPEGAYKTPVVVQGQTKGTRAFVAEHAISEKNGKEEIVNWVPDTLAKTVFVFGYKTGDTEGQLVFPDNQERTVTGRVNVGLSTPFPFAKSVAERRLKLYNMALDQAQGSFGVGTHLVNLRYESNKNPFVEKATLTADVMKGK